MRAFLALAAIAACNTPEDLPWVHGMEQVASSTGPYEPTPPFEPDAPPGCGVGATRQIELIADVAPSAGRETIVASYSGGIAVYDREEHLVMESPGYPCDGSLDELERVSVGSIYGTPTLAIVATTGGHRESVTWVGLFRIDRTLEATFAAVVETRIGDRVDRGAIYLIPGGLLYRHPNGRTSLWRLDPASKVYIPVLREPPHGDPDLRISSS